MRLGGDPQARKKAARRALTFSRLAEAYLTAAEKQLRARSFDAVKRHLFDHAKPIHHRPAHAIERSDIAELLGEIARARGPIAANRVRASLSAAWTWAIMEGLQQKNPIQGTVVRPETSRERTLNDAELAAIWRGTATGSDHDRITRLLMLTGCRRDEIGRMNWNEMSGDLLVVPGAPKNRLPLEVPLVSLALAQLPQRRPGNDAVFGKGHSGYSGWSRSKARLDGRIKIADWTLHDLRRTLSTGLSEMGVEPHYVEALLNHVSGAAKRGVAGTYNRALCREQKRSALARWANHIATIASDSV